MPKELGFTYTLHKESRIVEVGLETEFYVRVSDRDAQVNRIISGAKTVEKLAELTLKQISPNGRKYDVKTVHEPRIIGSEGYMREPVSKEELISFYRELKRLSDQ